MNGHNSESESNNRSWLSRMAHALWRHRGALAPWAASFLLLAGFYDIAWWYYDVRALPGSGYAVLTAFLLLSGWSFIGCWYGEKRALERDKLLQAARQAGQLPPRRQGLKGGRGNGEYGRPIKYLPPALRDIGFFLYILLLLLGLVLAYKLLDAFLRNIPDLVITYVWGPILPVIFGFAGYCFGDRLLRKRA